MKELLRNFLGTYFQNPKAQTPQQIVAANNVFTKESRPELSSSANDKDESLFMLSQTTDGQHNDVLRQVESGVHDHQQP